jgi:hypothetical protein
MSEKQEVSVDVRKAIVNQKLALYRQTIYDHEIELRIYEKVKDEQKVEQIGKALVKFTKLVNELETIVKELEAEKTE